MPRNSPGDPLHPAPITLIRVQEGRRAPRNQFETLPFQQPVGSRESENARAIREPAASPPTGGSFCEPFPRPGRRSTCTSRAGRCPPSRAREAPCPQPAMHAPESSGSGSNILHCQSLERGSAPRALLGASPLAARKSCPVGEGLPSECWAHGPSVATDVKLPLPGRESERSLIAAGEGRAAPRNPARKG